MNEELRFKDLEDCDNCPIKKEHPDLCSYVNGLGRNDDPLCAIYHDSIIEDYLNRYYRNVEAKYIEEEKKQIKAKRIRDAKNYVRNETNSIKVLKKRKAKIEGRIHFFYSMAECYSAVENIINRRDVGFVEPESIRLLRKDIEEIDTKIKSIEAIKKNKLKEFRRQYKNK